MARGSIHGQELARGSIHVHGQGLARGTIHGQGYYTWPGVGQVYYTIQYMAIHVYKGSCPSVGKDFEMPTRTEAGG